MGVGLEEGEILVKRMFDSIKENLRKYQGDVVRDGNRSISLRMKMPANPLASTSLNRIPSYLSSSTTLNRFQHKLLYMLQSAIRFWTWGKSQMMRKSTWTTSILMLSLGATVCFLAMYCYLRLGSNSQGRSLYELKEGLNAGFSLDSAEIELESDEYEFEDDSDAEVLHGSGQTTPLRRLIHLRNGQRRTGGKDTSLPRRSGSIVRITSSDPRSSLSSAPIQLDLDPKAPAMEIVPDAATASIIQQSGSAARRRRESGRLLNGINNGTTTPITRNPNSRLASPMHANSPHRPARSSRRIPNRRGSDTSTLLPENLSNRPEERFPSPTNSNGSGSDQDDPTTPLQGLGLPSILKRKAEVYASIPRIEPIILYGMSEDSLGESALHVESQRPSEISQGGYEGDYLSTIPPPVSTVGRLPPGAGHAPNSALRLATGPTSPRLGALTAAQARAIWPERRAKTIRLQEPDWTPYVEVHDRAKERLEAAANVAARPRSVSPPQGQLSQSNTAALVEYERENRERNIIEGQLTQEEKDEEEEFWFERYSQSTAAAGRDWDWRKRRKARQMAAAAEAAAAAAEAAAALAGTSAVADAAPSEDAAPFQSSHEVMGVVGVNMLDDTMYGNSSSSDNLDSVTTDARQLQENSTELTRKTGQFPNLQEQAHQQQQQQQQQQPFAASNGVQGDRQINGRPTLSVTTSDSYLFRGGSGLTNQSSPIGKPNSSPMSKVLRLTKFSNSSTPSYIDGSNKLNGFFKSESSTDVTLSPPFQDGSVEDRPRKERNSLSGLRRRRSSEANYREAKEAVNVPNRFSSLTPKGMKRTLSAKRERDAALTAQLLAEAEEVPTDEEEQERIQQSKLQLPVKVKSSNRSLKGLRKSASSSLLGDGLEVITAPSRSTMHMWPDSEAAVWSSADAYGPNLSRRSLDASMPLPSQLHHNQVAPPIFSNDRLQPSFAAMSQDLARQGSKTESHSSRGSNIKVRSPQDHQTFSPSTEAILSSARTATVGRRLYSDEAPVKHTQMLN